jgi:hypothetical protein
VARVGVAGRGEIAMLLLVLRGLVLLVLWKLVLGWLVLVLLWRRLELLQ